MWRLSVDTRGSDQNLLTDIEPTLAFLAHPLATELVAEEEIEQRLDDRQVVRRCSPTGKKLLPPAPVEHDRRIVSPDVEERLVR
jgi:hypothetical protein